MSALLQRVGTIYIPVADPEKASKWYQDMLGAVENFRNEDQAILDLANQSFFCVKAKAGESSGFIDHYGNQHFSVTFEVDGLGQLRELHSSLASKGVAVGKIEDRGHPGYNFVFSDIDGNKFDVWSELSSVFKEKFGV
ncbi:VOC family protein [Edaphobacillus lindanitolerans]|uniref:VOC domain-containing protein n=1 Tax=Edaphobacillus lindanitolerans TaxID=550447 RepID=A0A1U7PNL7_9BACI|nr:VOC family protein [Edaphobacillus lindanitolerans]SIT92976.1 hypothetical protein SAMN05428946_2907 [Edaphobacillus lindanitolerans]